MAVSDIYTCFVHHCLDHMIRLELIKLYHMTRTEETKTPRRTITEEKTPEVFDHQIHQTLGTNVIGCRLEHDDIKFLSML